MGNLLEKNYLEIPIVVTVAAKVCIYVYKGLLLKENWLVDLVCEVK